LNPKIWISWFQSFDALNRVNFCGRYAEVYMVIDEFILAGEIQETSKKEILTRLAELEDIKG
jgi:hypothetical protein